jgi:excisionase family DNA binding protein
MTTSNQLLTVAQVAEDLGLSEQTVRRTIASGELPAIRLGLGPKTPIRVIPEELRAWLRSDPRRVTGR